MEPSGCDSSPQPLRSRCPLAEHSPSSQESTNRANRSPNLDGKNAENNAGKNVPCSMAPDAVEEDDCGPLSGKPFITCILGRAQVQPPYQMVIPSSFVSLLPSARVPVVLLYHKKKWEMSYCGDLKLKKFDSGWREFVMDNNLQIGDGFILEFMDEESLTFQTRVLRGDIPQRFADGGQSSESPIVLD